MKRTILKIHGWYIISILTSIIICLLTIDFGENDNLVAYISFAATISSILLAVVAIIYSFYSNSEMSKSLGTLDTVSKDVIKNTILMTSASENLRLKIEEIPTFLKPIEEKADITNTRLEQLAHGTNIISSNNIDNDVKLNFLNTSSFLGNKILYACLIALEKNKEFKLKSISELSITNNENYMYGFLVASASFNLIRYTMSEEILKVTFIDDFIKSHLKDIIYKKADNNDTGESEIKNWASEILAIESFFATN